MISADDEPDLSALHRRYYRWWTVRVRHTHEEISVKLGPITLYAWWYTLGKGCGVSVLGVFVADTLLGLHHYRL